jgi:acetate kinase
MSKMPVLVMNAGSSSLKYQLVVPETAEVQAKGVVERIGEPGSPIADHAAAMQAMGKDLAAAGVDLDEATGWSMAGRTSQIPPSSMTRCSRRSRI